jgi:hypothetical protein
MKRLILILFSFVYCLGINAQQMKENLPGQVSYIASQTIYVKFKSTLGITAGDTLFSANQTVFAPVLVVSNLSSASCVCTALSGTNLNVGDLIIARVKSANERLEGKPAELPVGNIQQKDTLVSPVASKTGTNERKQKIKGSISAFSYSDFSNVTAKNSLRFRYTLSLDARNIANSRFSTETYISFRHKYGDWAEVQNNVFNALKIYTLAVKYDLNKTTQISFGRRINPRISSIGAMDGLQVEKTIKQFTLGGVIGSRPDYIHYSIDPTLFQYGAFVAYNSKAEKPVSESSLAFMTQTNNSKIDRRFLYFQHSNSLTRNIFFFGTFEVDLFKLENNKPINAINPTGLYLSLRYKMNQKITVSGSYDARKNVMYYETYKTLIDSLMEKELRQGFRLQGNYRITKDIMFGLQGGYRYLKSDPHPSKNIYSYLTYSQIPGLHISTTLSATYLESNYMNGKILGISMTRDLLEGKIQTGLGYRFVDYRLPENLLTIKQNIGEANLSWQFSRKMSFSVNYEGTFEQKARYNRIYFQIRKRF